MLNDKLTIKDLCIQNIHPNHLEDLRKSGLSDGTIESAGIHTVLPGRINKIFEWDIPINSLLAFPYQNTVLFDTSSFRHTGKRARREHRNTIKSQILAHIYISRLTLTVPPIPSYSLKVRRKP